MSAIVKGKGLVWSVGALVFTAGVVSGTDAAAQQSQRLERTSEKAELKDVGGTIIGQVFHGFKKTLTLTISPYHATTQAGAYASANNWFLQPGTLVTITNAAGDFAAAADNYNVISASQPRVVDGLAMIDLVLEAGDEGVELATAPIT